MLWKLACVAVLAVGVFGEYTVTEEHRQQAKQAIAAICKKSNAEDKASEVEATLTTFGECMKGLINFETIKKEIEEAKPNGALDEVFKKYCAKSAQLKACIIAGLTGVMPCVPAELREIILPIATNATDKLVDFACYKDGDRIALFIAEDGPQCFQEKMDAIKTCGENIKSSVSTTEAAQALSLQEKCSKFDQGSACVVTALEGCENPTPANMAEAVFKFIKKITPCATKK